MSDLLRILNEVSKTPDAEQTYSRSNNIRNLFDESVLPANV